MSAGETIAEIETPDGIRTPVTTRIAGILRGLLRDGYPVTPGFKVADVDPRRENWKTASSSPIRRAASREVCWS